MQSTVARKYAAFFLLWITPMGFICKRYSGPAHGWFNDYGAGLLYEVFWILVVFFFIPKKGAVHAIPLWVFGVTGVLEALQLWHPPLLEKIRSNFWGSALFGTTFVWWDFLYYAVGCGVGWRILHQIAEKSVRPHFPKTTGNRPP